MLKRIFICLLPLFGIFSCTDSDSVKNNLLLNNKNIGNIFIIDNNLFYCIKNQANRYEIIDYERKTVVADSIEYLPETLVKYKDGYMFCYKDLVSSEIKVSGNGFAKSFKGELIWKDNSNFIFKNYQYLGGKDYLVSLVSFPSSREIEFYNYSITTPKYNTKIVIINNDTTSILTPELKLLSTTLNSFFAIYDGRYFELGLKDCMLMINQTKIKVCYENILDIKFFKEHFYILCQHKNSLLLINDNSIISDSISITETIPVSIFYHDNKLQIATLNESNGYLYTKKGKTNIIQQFLNYNGSFYSIEENNNELFFYNEHSMQKVKLGMFENYEGSELMFDYFAIRMNNKVLVIDKDLNERGYFEGYELASVKTDNNLFVLTSEGKLYKF